MIFTSNIFSADPDGSHILEYPLNSKSHLNPLRIGEIPYLNMLPIFRALKYYFDTSNISFIKGHPSWLNLQLRNGLIDISPSSSIEYAKFHDRYLIVPDISISSLRMVKSVLLFSPFDISDENRFTVHVTSHSESSLSLLKIEMEEFLGKKITIKKSENPGVDAVEDGMPYLLIGDEAIRESLNSDRGKNHTMYDLGNIWHTHTGLPFVYALWIVNVTTFKNHRMSIKKFCRKLLDAKKIALNLIKDRNQKMMGKGEFPQGFLSNYWSTLSYDLKDELKGLELFFNLARKRGLLANNPQLNFVDLP